MATVTLEGLNKTYDGGVVAVHDLDLEVRDGELLVLVGPSGCGKTTTLRMVAGLETATRGSIRIGEREVTHVEPRDRDIAMVFQSYALYPHMTVRQNLSFGLRMRKTAKPEIERRIAGVAEKLGLEPLLERKPAALSGGQRQRVALGRAMVREPAVFLFDEPLSNLDAKLRVRTRAELVRLHRELAATMIYVTHDQTEAMTMGERIAILDRGELQQVASPLEVYDRPANLFVAGFIGSPPMNLFAGSLLREDEGPRFRGPSFTLALPAAAAADGAPTRDVVLGIRPEHLDLDVTRGVRRPDAFEANVLVVEALGPETLVHCRTAAGEDVVARTPARPQLEPGGVVALRPDAARLHLFDAPSGHRIAPQPA